MSDRSSTSVKSRATARARVRRVAAGAALAAGASLVLAGCMEPVEVEPAENADDARCSQVMITLPEEISGQEKRRTTSQSTAAWGQPASAVLRCGEVAPKVTSDPCTTMDGVDWTARENDDDDTWTISTYGREPFVTVTVDTKKISSSDVATALADSVKNNKPTKKCTDARDMDLDEGDADGGAVQEDAK